MKNLENIADEAYDKAVADDGQDTKHDDTKDDTKDDVTDTGAKDSEDKKDEDDEDSGYTVDDLEEDEEEVKEPVEKEAKPIDSESLPPREQYIYENLPTIRVVGKDGDTYDVKIAQELPEDFEFKNDRDKALFNQRLNQQERKANELLDEYTKTENTKQAEQFMKQEKLDIQSDLAQLQKDGLIGKYKLKPSEKGFEDDPNVKLTQEILDFYEKENLQLAKDQKAYRISFKHAAEIYLARNPKQESKGDAERKQVSEKVVSNKQGDKDTGSRMKFREGTQIADIVDYWDSRL